ncbi:MAG: hypothetical protein ABIH34_05915 [Nanoarchaeota archaeon]
MKEEFILNNRKIDPSLFGSFKGVFIHSIQSIVICPPQEYLCR